MIKYTFIALCSILISCSSQTENKKSIETNTDNLNNSKKPSEVKSINKISSESNSKFYNNKIFISILPSDIYLDSIQKTVPENEWDEVASDNEYYRDLTEKFLLEKGYKLADRPNDRFWHFILKDGRTQIIDTVSLHDKWGNLIFNGKDSAFIFESISPDIELKDKI